MSMVINHDEKRIVPRSAIRHRPIGTSANTGSIPTPRSSRAREQREPHTTGGLPSIVHTKQNRASLHWFVPAGAAMATTVLLIWLIQAVWAWGTLTYNDLHYGRPRTMQIDAVVGHNDSTAHPTHFVGLNLGGHIQILELPGGDPRHARMVVGPTLTGPGADLVPVLLSFADINGDHLLDMRVQCGDVEAWFRNEHGTFVPQ